MDKVAPFSSPLGTLPAGFFEQQGAARGVSLEGPHRGPEGDERPGDWYNRCGDVQALLEAHGWTLKGSQGHNQQWVRPGKQVRDGIGATFHMVDRVFYVFTSSTDLPEGQHSPFDLYALLRHGGDHRAAARAVRAMMPAQAVRRAYGEPSEPVATAPGPRSFRLTRMADVPEENIRWLWNPRIAIGKLTILGGDPGGGKGWITLSLAALLSRGAPFPDGGHDDDDERHNPVSSLMVSYEDGPGDTIRPRLVGLGADLTRIHVVENDYPVTPDNVDELSKVITEAKFDKLRLVVIDPIGSYVGSGTNTSKDNEVRSALTPLATLAREHGVAVLLVMHLNKSDLTKALYRLSGSVAFSGLPRSVLVAGEDESGQKGLAHVKNNLGPKGPPIEYRLEEHGKAERGRSPFSWGRINEELSGDRLMGAALVEGKRPIQIAEEWLAEYLTAHGPTQARHVIDAAFSAKLTETTLKRARANLGVIATKEGPGWTWTLPPMS